MWKEKASVPLRVSSQRPFQRKKRGGGGGGGIIRKGGNHENENTKTQTLPTNDKEGRNKNRT